MSNAMPLLCLLAGIVSFFILYLVSKKQKFNVVTLLALVFGVVLGLIFKGNTNYLAIFGTIFIRVISMMVIPLIFVSLVNSIFFNEFFR